MNRLFEKWFCKHKWKTHCAKEVTKETYVENGLGRYSPTGIKKTTIREILICSECGKIKKIEY